MGRLIDIDRLCNDLAKRWSIADKKKEDLIRAVMADVVTPIVVSQPTVDAVPVVRCRDCEHKDRESGFCHGRGWPMQLVPDDGFCDKGKAR